MSADPNARLRTAAQAVIDLPLDVPGPQYTDAVAELAGALHGTCSMCGIKLDDDGPRCEICREEDQ